MAVIFIDGENMFLSWVDASTFHASILHIVVSKIRCLIILHMEQPNHVNIFAIFAL